MDSVILSSPEKEALATSDTRLPRRDYFIIPLISLITIAVMIGSAETASRVIWPDHSEDACSQSLGHHKPNCSTMQKTMEGPAYIEAYNQCGYRSVAPCGPKPPGHTRIALLGSSFTLGFGVSYEQAFPGKTEQELTKACKRPVEIQNLSGVQLQPIQIYRRVDEALALQPDLLILSINPTDAHTDYSDDDIRDRDEPAALERRVPPMSPLKKLIKNASDQLTFIQVLQHFRYLNQDDYIHHFLQYGDEVDYLRTPLSETWTRRFAQLDILLGAVAEKARQKGVPVVFISGLSRVQVGLMSESSRPTGIDPFAFERGFAEIAARHGIVNIDPTALFSGRPDAANLFYPVNGHLTEEGNTVYQQALTRGLLSSDLAIFQACSKPTSLTHQNN
jgi:hypothetical protein